jgi:3-oxoacyl-[acyl-carrier-protein] synthase-1
MDLKPPTKPVYLKACGMATPVGLTAEQTAAAVRAGTSSYDKSSIYNKQFNPMVIAMLPENTLPPLENSISQKFPGLTTRQSRMIRLAHVALIDLASKFEGLNGLPILVSGPETLPEMKQTCHPEFIKHISMQSGVNFHETYSALLTAGRAGGVQALQYAMAYVEGGFCRYAIVGGVDSYLDLYLLSCLDKEDRILSDGVMDGFAPGEGAGFLLISSDPETFQDSGQQIFIYPPGLANEPGHRFSGEPYQGDGLAQSFSLALSFGPIGSVKTVYASLNGENFGAKELGVATVRNSDRIDANYSIEHPADSFGDIGATFLPVAIGIATIDLIKEYINGPVLAYASSETQYRGAACVAKH